METPATSHSSRLAIFGWLFTFGLWSSVSLSGCSSPSAQTAGSTTEDLQSGDSAESAGTASPGGTSQGSSESGPAPNPTEPETPATPIESGAPVVLADGLVFPARLCFGSNGDVFFPNRLGYPETLGSEELWTVSRSDGPPRRVATLGSVTGCAASGLGLWVSSNTGDALARIDEQTGQVLGTLTTGATPVQVVSNSSEVFASLTAAGAGAAVVAIKPAVGALRELWSRSGAPLVSWLKATDSSLFFSANDYQEDIAWIVHVDLASGNVRELITDNSELGAVDNDATHVFFTDHDRGEVRRVALEGGESTVVATLPGAWSLLLDGDFLYVGSRPDFCAGSEGKIHRVSTSTGETTLLAENLGCPSQLVSDAQGLYWVNSGSWQGPELPTAAPADGSVMFLPR